jgi:hypothetical protein
MVGKEKMLTKADLQTDVVKTTSGDEEAGSRRGHKHSWGEISIRMDNWRGWRRTQSQLNRSAKSSRCQSEGRIRCSLACSDQYTVSPPNFDLVHGVFLREIWNRHHLLHYHDHLLNRGLRHPVGRARVHLRLRGSDEGGGLNYNHPFNETLS